MGRFIISNNKKLVLVLVFPFGMATWIFIKHFNESKKSSAIDRQVDIPPIAVQEDTIVCDDYFAYDKYTSQSLKHKR